MTMTSPTSSLPRATLALVLGKGIQTGSGFLFWILVGRTVPVDVVGTLSAATSAVILVSQVAVIGMPAALITLLGRGRPLRATLDASLTLVAAVALAVALVYVATAGRHPGVVPPDDRLAFHGLLLLAAVAGSIGLCLDATGLVLGHARSGIARYLAGGCAQLLAYGCLLLATDGDPSATLGLVAWTLDGAAVCAVGAWQLRRWRGYRFQPSLQWQPVRETLRVGMPNYALSLTESFPAYAIPVLVALVASPKATGYWYPAWMMVSVSFLIVAQVGWVQLSHGVLDPLRMRHAVRRGLVWSVGLGGAAALVIAAAASPLLGLVGPAYAEASTDVLRTLCLGAVPLAVLFTYNARARATGRFTEAITVGVLRSVAIVGAVLVAGSGGTQDVAVAWLVVTALAGLWAGLRLWAQDRSGEPLGRAA